VAPVATPKKAAAAAASKKVVSAEVSKQAAKTIPVVAPAPVEAPDLTKVLWPLATLSRPAEPPPEKPKRPAIDVGSVITRALTAAGLMK